MGTEIKASEDIQSEQPVSAGRGKSRKRSIITFVIVSVLNAGLLILLWTQLLTPAHGPNNNTASVDPLLNKPAPDFTLAMLGKHGGAALNLASLKGKPVVINFWSSTCGPCADEAGLFQKTWQQARAKGVIFIGVDFEDTTGAGLSFLQKYGITYTNVMDSSGSAAIDYGVTGVPETFFINRQGIIVGTVRQEITAQQLQGQVAALAR